MHNQNHTDNAVIIRALHRIEECVTSISSRDVPSFVSIDEAAEILGVSADTIRRLLYRREIAYVQARPNAAKRIPLDDLQRWIDEHTTRPIAR